jgi:hypothetical protein
MEPMSWMSKNGGKNGGVFLYNLFLPNTILLSVWSKGTIHCRKYLIIVNITTACVQIQRPL